MKRPTKSELKRVRYILADADFNERRTHRFRLRRGWLPASHCNPLGFSDLLFVGLNPSTADEACDDPTIRRLTAHARFWGYPGFTIVNLWACCASSPESIRLNADLEEENTVVLRQAMKHSKKIVCIWGSHWRVWEMLVKVAVQAGRWLYCFEENANGMPRHPLYLQVGRQMKPWMMKEKFDEISQAGSDAVYHYQRQRARRAARKSARDQDGV